jgi:hypothetical protein
MLCSNFYNCQLSVIRLTAVIGLSLLVLSTPSKSLQAEVQDDSAKALSRLMPTSIDPYWSYYETCDRWGVEFAVQNGKTDRLLRSRLQAGEQRMSKVAKTQFRQIGYIYPQRRSTTNLIVGFASQGKSAVCQTWSCCRCFSVTWFHDRIRPLIDWAEFGLTETTTYPEFFLINAPGPWERGITFLGRMISARWSSVRGLLSKTVAESAPIPMGWPSPFIRPYFRQAASRVLQNNTILGTAFFQTWDF